MNGSRAALVLLGVSLALGSMAVEVRAAPVAPRAPDCLDADPGGNTTPPRENTPYDALRIDRAHDWLRRRGVEPGEGVGVVVVSSGVAPAQVPVQEQASLPPANSGPLRSAHGTAVAGILGGEAVDGIRLGVAPGAGLWSVRVHDEMPDAAGAGDAVVPTAAAVARGLVWVRERPGLAERRVVVVPAVVPRSKALTAELRRLEGQGVLVVGAAGDGWPASSPRVLAAAPAGEAVEDEEPPGAVDVAAPTAGGVSYGLDGACTLDRSPEWAAAYVAGTAALVWSAHPGLGVKRLRDRLTRTATGNGTADSPLVGYGTVQPLEALQRRPGRRPGAWAPLPVARAEAPQARDDRMIEPRRDLAWWGIGAAGALLAALVLRRLVRTPPGQRH